MNILFTATILSLSLLMGGCSSDYVMATTEGNMILTRGKPIFDKETGRVTYTDKSGHQIQMNSDKISSVVER